MSAVTFAQASLNPAAIGEFDLEITLPQDMLVDEQRPNLVTETEKRRAA